MLLVDEYRHIGQDVPLGIARNATDELLENPEGSGDLSAEIPTAPTAADNDAALESLMSQMGGIRG